MKLTLELKEAPFVFELENEAGVTCGLDASPEIGGTQKGLRPMELLAGSLAGCAAIDMLSVLRKQRLNPEKLKVRIEAVRRQTIPAAFDSIHLIVETDADLPPDRLERAVRLTLDKYCSVAASLSPDITLTFEIHTV